MKTNLKERYITNAGKFFVFEKYTTTKEILSYVSRDKDIKLIVKKIKVPNIGATFIITLENEQPIAKIWSDNNKRILNIN